MSTQAYFKIYLYILSIIIILLTIFIYHLLYIDNFSSLALIK